MKNWTIQLTNDDYFKMSSPRPQERPEINHMQTIKNKKNRLFANRDLSSTEQFLIAKYYIYPGDSSELLSNPQKFGINRIQQYSTHFEESLYLYSNDELKFIQLMNATKESLIQFEKQKQNLSICRFVKELYLSPHNKFKDLGYWELNRTKNIFFQLKKGSVKTLEYDELNQENELIEYLTICQPEFGVEPNGLLFNEDLQKNYVIRLLASVFKDIFLVVNEPTNRVVSIVTTL
ncbi:hypothetical protein [Bacillus norwichensis]|uniref:Uncharacterized protein n=1 Tax=Bacillus norwichensis TaxID=2762217 RepID=A0ABR8VM34_9BACI|nr:hypothetical protein [Bacillus norwichensis]MBD8005810.1 hypothetical protein [Bacillus norwichensis]